MAATHTQLIPVVSRSVGSWQIRIERQPLSPDALTARYDRAAAGWARMTDRYGYSAAYRDVFERFFADSDLGCGPLRALDIGVGAGAFSLALAATCRGPLELSTVDLSTAMLAESTTRLAQRGIAVAGHCADARSLPFATASFDLVIAAHVYEHLPDPVVALREATRVLRPGGWLVTCMTRRSWLGRYIQTKWRTHRVCPAGARHWLEAAGLEPGAEAPDPRGVFRLTSLAAVARKPVEPPHEELAA